MSERIWIWTVIIMTAITGTGCGAASPNVHKCAGAGQWFPADPVQLRKEVTKYLDEAKVKPPEGRVVAVVAPHAGYAYSGPIAGCSYGLVRGRSYDRVVILAFSHRYPVEGLSVLNVDAYETPLGQVPVDRGCVKRLLKSNLVQSLPAAHRTEHSDENQLPFLQVALKPGWKLLSVFVGYDMNMSGFDEAASLLRPCIDDKTLIVVSSDFTHIPNSNPKLQNKYDLAAVDLLLKKDFQGFLKYVSQDPQRQGSICGARPLALMLKLIGDKAEGHLLKHVLSGEMTGDYSWSVGYTSLAYTVPNGQDPAPKTQKSEANVPGKETSSEKAANPAGPATKLISESFLTVEEERTLLRLARDALTQWVKSNSKKLDLAQYDLTPALVKEQGAFVTLDERGQLRGCIGYIEGIKPLYETVIENARNAATNDPRFSPVQPRDLPLIDIDISVMTPLKRIHSIDEIEVGRHGIILRKGGHQGVFLPQVPVEMGWDLQQYLDGICRKAYLPRGAWKEPDAELYIFSAQVFGEKETETQ